MTRYLTSGGWRATDTAVPSTATPTAETLVERGLLHSENLNLANSDLLTHGINSSTMIRLTDGPGGTPRWASYYDVMMTNPWAYGTIHTIARGLARLPLKLYEADLDTNTEPGTVHKIINPDRNKDSAAQIAWALRYPTVLPGDDDKLPNAPLSRKALWYGTAINKMIYGNAIWEIRRKAGRIVGFTFHPMETVEMDEENQLYKIKKPEYGQYIFQDVTGRKAERVLTPDKVVHYGLWESGRRPFNPSPVRSLHATIALFDAVTRTMTSYFNNGARPSGHLKIESLKGDKAIEHVRSELAKLHSGADQAGKVLVTSGDWQQLHREPEFDGVINLLKHSRDEIFVTYGVPPPVMGVIERAIMSNVREMRDQYVRDLIGPHAEFLSGDFEAQVIDRDEKLRDRNVFAYFDVDEQLRPDLWKRASSFRNLLLAYTPNELRRIERQPKLEGAADPDGRAETIQRPLNESALNNQPDYNIRDEALIRRVIIDERRLEHELEHGSGNEPHINDDDAPDAPASNNEEGDGDAGDDE